MKKYTPSIFCSIVFNDQILKAEVFGRGIVWLDTGSFDDLHEAASFVRTIEKRQGLKICCPEEISWVNKWIDDRQLYDLATKNNKNSYGNFLLKLLESNEVLN